MGQAESYPACWPEEGSINADRLSLARLQRETEFAYTDMWKELAKHDFAEDDIAEITHELAMLHSIDLRIGYGFLERTPTPGYDRFVGRILAGGRAHHFTSGFNPQHSIPRAVDLLHSHGPHHADHHRPG